MCMVKIDIKEFYMSGKPGFDRSSSMMKLRIFNSWLQKLLIVSAEINMCSRNSCLT